MVHNPAGAVRSPATTVCELWLSLVGAFDRMGLTEEHVFVSGSGAAVKWTGTGVGCNGAGSASVASMSSRSTTAARSAGLWSYWNPAALRTQLRAGP